MINQSTIIFLIYAHGMQSTPQKREQYSRLCAPTVWMNGLSSKAGLLQTPWKWVVVSHVTSLCVSSEQDTADRAESTQSHTKLTQAPSFTTPISENIPHYLHFSFPDSVFTWYRPTIVLVWSWYSLVSDMTWSWSERSQLQLLRWLSKTVCDEAGIRSTRASNRGDCSARMRSTELLLS